MHQEIHPPRGTHAEARDVWFLAAVVILVGGAPCLLFPSIASAIVGGWVAPLCIAAAMVPPLWLVRQTRPLAMALALFEIAVAASWWHTPAHDAEALSHTAGLAFGLLLMGALAVWCRTVDRLLTVAGVFCLVASFVLVVALLAASHQGKLLVPALSGHLTLSLPGLESGTVNPNAAGGTALLVAPLSLALWSVRQHVRPAIRSAALLASVVAVAVVVISGSHTAWLATLLITLSLGGWAVHRRLRRPAASLLLVALCGGVLIAGVAFAWRDTERLSIATGQVQDTISMRREIWARSLQVLRSSPWFGTGISQFRDVWVSATLPEGGRFLFHEPHADNIFLQVGLDLGLPGLAAYLALMTTLLVMAWRAAHGPDATAARLAAGAAASLVAVHLFGLADAIALGAKVGAFQWAACGVILAASRLQAPRAAPAAAAPAVREGALQ